MEDYTNYYGKGIKVGIEEQELVIRVPFDTMANAFELSDYNTSYDDETGDFIKLFKVTDKKEFAISVRYALTGEEEDGSSLITNSLDKACQDAVESGCDGVEEIEQWLN